MNKKNTKAKNMFIRTLACCLLFVICIYGVNADGLDDYQVEIDRIKSQQKSNINKLTGVEKEIAENLYEITELDEKVVKNATELNKLQKTEEEVNNKMLEYEKALTSSSDAYNEILKQYSLRLRQIYENGIPTIWDLLLSSKGISDFFRKLTVYESVLKYDKTMIGSVKSKKEYTDYVKKDMETKKTQLVQLKETTAKSMQALQNSVDAKQKKVSELEGTKESLKETAKALDQQEIDSSKKLQEEVDKIRKAAQNPSGSGDSITFSSGQFAWLAPGYNIITTKFNVGYDPWNTGKVTVHMGVDVAGAGIMGKPMVAIEGGEVTLATYYGGYGNCVMINHGKSATDGSSYISLYGHASALNVSKGDKVEKGQTIALIGSTGNSTGPHIHFELYKDGVKVDPLSYYSDMKFIYY